MNDERPIGPPVLNWTPPPRPDHRPFDGRYARLEPLNPALHAAELHAAFAEDAGGMWDYMPVGPFADADAFRAWADTAAAGTDPLFWAIRDHESESWAGVFSLLRIAPEAGSIEIGYIAFAPRMQRSRAATEAVWMLMSWAFLAGYRRFEWKCNALNAASRRAAQRYGMSYEGVFRQAAVVKGHNRDTAWYACIDLEFPLLQTAFEGWLAEENFDAEGRQIRSLSALTAPILVARG
ncbi:GNAT family N-acetyltransferase [Paroceanicella profunda]|uniref:GNAT family N-acetyltransferase n=1 Tax=Paroceanicella profunda TaxID=2579971 RepID=A0A5B8FH55_9RHOB|nr:GNAT family protein [Paroceanicella profunda]QDL92021.1 GNAT family N-acetyltransferase [Paroceanicella profunda]